LLSLFTGFAAGTLHVFAGPDHLAALAPLALRQRKTAMRTGAAWGLGHGTGVAIVGSLAIAARSAIDVEALSAYSELVVGVLLIAIGLWAIRKARKLVIHTHHHAHNDQHREHAHPHLHAGGLKHEHPLAHARHTHAAFGVGILHGAAGTGHIFGVLPSLALPAPQAAVYLLAYLVAAVVAMAGFGAVLGAIAQRSGARTVRALMAASGAAAVGVGILWLANSWSAIG